MDLRAVAKLFSRGVLKGLSEQDGLAVFRGLVRESGLLDEVRACRTTIGDALDRAFDTLVASYRNEYVYKNLVARQLMLDLHSADDAVLLSEFRAYESLADLVILNGTSSVYEIKSELDNLTRLDKQLSDYLKIFDRVNVVTHCSCTSTLLTRLPRQVGIVELNESGLLVTVREANSNVSNLSSKAIFYSLRRNEYEAILLAAHGELPRASPARMMSACADMFGELPPTIAHSMMVERLKDRDRLLRRSYYVRSLPYAMTHFGLSANFSRRSALAFSQAMQLPAV